LPQVENTVQAASGNFLRSPLASNAGATAVPGRECGRRAWRVRHVSIAVAIAVELRALRGRCPLRLGRRVLVVRAQRAAPAGDRRGSAAAVAVAAAAGVLLDL